jgi:hypothetical protein
LPIRKVLAVISICLVLGLVLILAELWVERRVSTVAVPPLPQSGADWDGLFVGQPTVILNEGAYQMWYHGRRLSFYGYGVALGYAESADGRLWVKHTANPVLEPGKSGEWDSAFRGSVSVLKAVPRYQMWYSGVNAAGICQTGYATSSDGLDWETHIDEPVLSTGAPGSWDEHQACAPTVILDGAIFKMWYIGCNRGHSVCSIGYASSLDGVSWSKFAGNPVLKQEPGQWDASGIDRVRVLKPTTGYQLWYASGNQIGFAQSPDGFAWTKHDHNPILSQGWSGKGLGWPALLWDEGVYKMWAASGAGGTAGIGYFESTDGIRWHQPVNNPVIAKGEVGVIIHVQSGSDHVQAHTLANTRITISVSGAAGIKATISGVSDGVGHYDSWSSGDVWDPQPPEILCGDTVRAVIPGHVAMIEKVGDIRLQLDSDTNQVEGSVYAPWLAPSSLTVLCWAFAPDRFEIVTNVPANGGRFVCDFSGRADIAGGLKGEAGYLEPDGDLVTVIWAAPEARKCATVGY